MSEYKKGDLVFNKPSECVGRFNGEYEGNLEIDIPGADSYALWFPEDCELFRDPGPVIESMAQAMKIIGFAKTDDELYEMHDLLPLWCRERIDEIRDLKERAMEAESTPTEQPDCVHDPVYVQGCGAGWYECSKCGKEVNTPEEEKGMDVSEYKWLAMDMSKESWLYLHRPVWVRDSYDIVDSTNDSEKVNTPPSFLQSGQFQNRPQGILGFL